MRDVRVRDATLKEEYDVNDCWIHKPRIKQLNYKLMERDA